MFDNVPRQIVKTLDRDLAVAGIPKTDDRGRTVDFHAFRHSFGTLLSVSGVAPRTAQQAMRHSKIELTMNTYTDPRLLDVAGAIESLPSLPIDSNTAPETQPQVATGTDNWTPSLGAPTVAPTVAPNADVLVQQVSKRDKKASCDGSKLDGQEHEQSPQKPLFLWALSSDADGTRTRNHRIDSPVL